MAGKQCRDGHGEEHVNPHRVSISLALFAILAACSHTIPDYDYSKEPDPRKSEYVIGVSDGLDINVWKNPELSTRVTVRPDGTITMPLIGDLQAVGKTTTELKGDIRTKLSRFMELEGLEITIAVTTVASYHFTVSGEVENPGIFNSNRYMTVVEAIAMAGGVTRFARKDQVVLLRRDSTSGTVRRIPIAYSLIADGQRPDMNIVLLSGDSLFVP
jgi:polysaccharide export outer membrane protein